ncbi:hypothetical protein QYE76_069773 [Lolium multiflorum]|uniref:Uncharacterized protein n=1 Tax=Lolium multiflorum TaxID=4521 RepID=A0AAD8SI40_LOLMU|nr:hypothetical protein QYE76_069773 [Lolium multiflorum]
MALAHHADAIRKDRRSLRLQPAKKDATIARLRVKIRTLEVTVRTQQDQLQKMEEDGEDIQQQRRVSTGKKFAPNPNNRGGRLYHMNAEEAQKHQMWCWLPSQMAPFEALYERKCRTPLNWSEVGESQVFGPDVLREAEEKVHKIREYLKTAQSRQKSYADKRRREMTFEIGDFVYLKVSPSKECKDSS